MIDTDRLFELLDEAVYAVTCHCTTTTKAYLTMARQEWFRLIDDARDSEEEQKIRAAAVFIDRLVTREVWNEKSGTAARHAYDFWRGFEDGWHERTQRSKASTAFRRGYRFGRDGS